MARIIQLYPDKDPARHSAPKIPQFLLGFKESLLADLLAAMPHGKNTSKRRNIPKWLSEAQTAKRLNISVHDLRLLNRTDDLACCQIGHSRYYDPGDVDRCMSQRKQHALITKKRTN